MSHFDSYSGIYLVLLHISRRELFSFMFLLGPVNLNAFRSVSDKQGFLSKPDISRKDKGCFITDSLVVNIPS